jgi:ribonuclease BN (tRNA processing enzyme)
MNDKHGSFALHERRSVLATALRGVALGIIPAGFMRVSSSQQAVGGAPAGPAPPPATPGTRLVLLGTRGGPGLDLTHSQTASAVVVDGIPYLVDCGYGTIRQLVAANIGYQRIDRIFLTHLHDDHTADLAALLDFQWIGNKATPTDAYGPYGTERMVQGALGFSRGNFEIRAVDEGRTLRAQDLFHGHDITGSQAPVQVLKDDRVTVSAINNTHYPQRSMDRMPHRSIALRFDTRQRSIVFSGDTAYSENIVKLAQDADMFVCEVMDQRVHTQMLELARAEAAKGHPESVARHVAETHSTPEDVARMASAARVRTVVLNHQLSGPSTPGGLAFAVTDFIDAVRKGYAGEVIVGQDLMVL